jgi:lipoprotein signal peptidase
MQAAGRASLSGPDPDRGAPYRPRRVGALLFTAGLVVVLDVVTKVVAVERLSDRPPVRLLDGLVRLVETRNAGAAFGLGGGATVVFTLVAAGVIVAIARTAPRLRSRAWALSLGLLLGGATGNLLDRLLRSPGPLRGHVVDWIQLPHWPVFNLADASIVTGGALAVLLASRGMGVDGRPAASRTDG